MKQLFLIAGVSITLVSCGTVDDRSPAKDSNHNAYVMPHESSNDYADSVNSGLITNDTLKGSPLRIAMGNINGKHIHIEYGSPGLKGRVIWGGLVPYDKVWVTGAHNATNVTFSNEVIFGDKKIAAGKYALFTIPGKENWTVILNKNYDQHLADDYNETEDVARIILIPDVKEKIVQRLSYSVDQTGEQKGKIVMQWEKITLNIPVSFK